MRAKLQEIKKTLRKRMHWSVPAVGAWLKSVLIGHYRYYGVPNNWQLKKGKETYKACREKPGFTGWTPEGTAGITNWCNDVGALPTRNFKTSHCSYADNINGKAILKELKITDKGCFSCPIPCGKYGLAKTALGKAYVEGPEYETLSLLGSNCELSNIHDIAYTNYFCDELGLDTCSAGVVVGFALECYEKGYISRQEMGMDAVTGPIIFLAESPMKEGLF